MIRRMNAAALPRGGLARSLAALGLVASVAAGLAGHAPANAEGAPQDPPKERPQERLQVTDPYLELRTGPGRGYPIFFVAERNEWVEIELRYTDWYRVRTAGGKVGVGDLQALLRRFLRRFLRRPFGTRWCGAGQAQHHPGHQAQSGK